MIILHIAYLDDKKYSGPNINVPKNVLFGNKYAEVGLFNLCDSELAIDIPDELNFNIKKYNSIMDLPKPFNKPDIVVFQGIYNYAFCAIAKELKKRSIPYIIVPRCSMTTAAIKSHVLKKKIANILFFNKFIRNAEKIQFLTQNEYEESKNNFKFKDYYVLGNGVELSTQKYKVKKRNDFKIVFVGRYNIYHKGLDVLLDAVSNNKEWFEKNKVSILLYGSDSDNGLSYLIKRITREKLGEIVKICGPVFGEKKKEALLGADIFIHTSRLEGQPTSVIEAISYGVPVIVTPGTNMADTVQKENLGYTTKLDVASIFKCIEKAFGEKGNYPAISKRATDYAKKNFDWDKIMKKAIYYYNDREDKTC